jgi:hypothetical protein
VIRFFKLGLAVVLSLTLAAPLAGAQSDDLSGLGWAVLIGSVAFVLVFTAAGTVLGVGLDYVVPDAPFKLAEENVDIHLSAGQLSVSAEYVFQNDAEKDKKLELSYPFGRGWGVGPAANAAVTDGAGAEISFAWKKKNITFGVTVPAKSRATVVVKYEQPVSGTTFTYLLGKDRFWGFAGAHTAFTVTAPAAFGDVSSSYPLKKVSAKGDAAGYVFVRDDFYPQMNFTITWENAPEATP